MSSEIGVRFEKRGRAGIVTLDRPRALNALDHPMVGAMHAALEGWIGDPDIAHVVLHSANDRAFCVGGDIRAMHDLGKAGEKEAARAYWRDEYALDYLISRYPKPFVSLVDGLCFGGGFGMSGHGRYRVAGERLGFAMPEVAIGLFPDVGGTFVLPRLPGWTGTWLAMTGARIGMPDAVAMGLYTHHIPASAWPSLIEALAKGEAMKAALARFAVPAPRPTLTAFYPAIDRIFAGGSVDAVMTALDQAANGEDDVAAFVRAQRDTIRRASPTSVHIAFQQMQRGLGLDLAGCLGLEFRVVTRLLDQHDFYEGVRAVLIDKDQRPVWSPARLEDVDPAAIAAMFDQPLVDELVLT
ncbi:enoyl-CoA hydratase/isomerase family protein [Ancylobacter mangrovi]|uniref:enoyl-CoA hydratase/isomerase family protein n=1 Tax=Ancylobacter mangrovi TaxID=2972472 RepID=UPI002163D3FB|nr:enoyl-CoA hydratase/isomerase family protein [Ancylobacter mangrovi]MCS0503507.1 enoyl-CoA hydratase/isomerase family protein [Ancylobacter mangrovi]